jgi:hypothetical protein
MIYVGTKFSKENFHHNRAEDYHVCAMGQKCTKHMSGEKLTNPDIHNIYRTAKPITAKAAHPGPFVLWVKETGAKRGTVILKDTS